MNFSFFYCIGNITDVTLLKEQRVTGTEPFDTEEGAGNDTSAKDNIVRSFDKVIWVMEANMAVNNTEHGSEDAKIYNSFRGGTINVEISLPKEFEGKVSWAIEEMSWAEGTGKLSEDGLTFSGQYKMDSGTITVPGKQTLTFVLNVGNATNTMEIAPTIKAWLQGNETNPDNPGYEVAQATETDPVIVSSKARYNIKFLEASITRPNVEVDFDDGNGLVEGRMYGLGAIVQLYNTDPSKGMKGIEYPNGEITFDINMNLYKKTGSDDNIENITDSVTPRLWNYKINIGDNWGYTYSEGEIPNRSMHFGAYTSHNDGFMPYGVKTGNPDRAEGEIYNSGKVKMEQEKNQLHVSIDQYEINGEFPRYNEWYDEGYNIKYEENEGCFSSIYFQVFVPTDIENGENIYYGLELTEENMEIQSESGEIVKEQMKNDDDTVQLYHYTRTIH